MSTEICAWTPPCGKLRCAIPSLTVSLEFSYPAGTTGASVIEPPTPCWPGWAGLLLASCLRVPREGGAAMDRERDLRAVRVCHSELLVTSAGEVPQHTIASTPAVLLILWK